MQVLQFCYQHWVITTWFLMLNWGGVILTAGAVFEALSKKGK